MVANALDSFGTANKKTAGSAADLIRQHGAAFKLEKVPLCDWSGRASIAGQFVVVRKDTNTAIGMVGENYAPLDNLDFFCPIADALVEGTGAKIDRFSTLDDGARAIMRLSWDQDFRIGGGKVGDIVGRRAVITTSHDGKWAGKLILQALRLACSNGMTVPVGESEFGLTHSSNGKRQLADIVRMIPKIHDYFMQFQAAAEIMARTPILSTDTRCLDIIKKVMDPDKRSADTKSGELNKAGERVDRIHSLFTKQAGADNRAIKGTAWGLFNAFTDYYNHGKSTCGENETEQRFRSLLPGRNGGAAARDIVRAYGIVTKELKIEKAIAAAVLN